MAKLTLLEMVQDIANDLDTEEVNSITNTVESIQIAQIIKTSYFEIIANRNWPHLRRTISFDGLSTPSKPTHLIVPSLVKEVVSFSYNKRREESPTKNLWEPVTYLEPEHFLVKINSRDSTKSTIDSVTDFGGVTLLIDNDNHPQYYTSFDDTYIVCDSYNSALDSTLQSSKTQSICYVEPSWTHEDTFIPSLPSEAFPFLLEEAKSTASIVLRQVANEKAEQKSRRQTQWLSRKAFRTGGGIQYPDYGRKTVGYRHRMGVPFDKGN